MFRLEMTAERGYLYLPRLGLGFTLLHPSVKVQRVLVLCPPRSSRPPPAPLPAGAAGVSTAGPIVFCAHGEFIHATAHFCLSFGPCRPRRTALRAHRLLCRKAHENKHGEMTHLPRPASREHDALSVILTSRGLLAWPVRIKPRSPEKTKEEGGYKAQA